MPGSGNKRAETDISSPGVDVATAFGRDVEQNHGIVLDLIEADRLEQGAECDSGGGSTSMPSDSETHPQPYAPFRSLVSVWCLFVRSYGADYPESGEIRERS
jgi:hypothetical protein